MQGEVVGLYLTAPRQRRRPLDAILQLPHIPRPGVVLQLFQGFVCDVLSRCAQFLCSLVAEILGKEGDVGGALAKWGEFRFDAAETVIEVLAEMAVVDGLLEVAVGGGEDSAVRAAQSPLPPNPILRDLIVQGIPMHPKHPRRGAYVEAAGFEHLHDVLALDFGEGQECVAVGVVVGVVVGAGGVA